MPLFAKVRQVNPEEIKKQAQANIAKYEQETGQKIEQEQGLEEGDISDYVMPFKGLGKSLLKAVAEKSLQAGAKAVGKTAAKEAADEAKQGVLKYTKGQMQQKPQMEGPDYTKENIAFRPTNPKETKQVGWERFSFGKKTK